MSTYTATITLTRDLSSDWESAQANDFHEGASPREALVYQLLAELSACMAEEYLGGQPTDIAVVSLDGLLIDTLTPSPEE